MTVGGIDGWRGRLVVVAGFGASGRAAMSVLAEAGARVRVSEAGAGTGGPLPPGVEFLAGGHRPGHLDGAELLVASPGIPEEAPILGWAARAGIPIWSELELGARLCAVPVVAVTGTNGKTTTVRLVAEAMRAAGMDAAECGNVGHPFSLAARERHDALVVEASSFQLRFTGSLHPRVSALLNVAPDHLDWHGGFRPYAEAKARVFACQGPGDVHVGNRDDPEARRISRSAPCPVRWFGWGPPREAGGVGVVEGRVITRDEDLGAPPGAGWALLADAAAAAGACLAFGLGPDPVRRAIGAFRPLPHRGTEVASCGSVRFIDDSKATNPHATLAALEGRLNAVLIAGGLAKGVDLAPLAQAAPSLAGVVAIGEAGPALQRVFADLVPVRRAGSIEDAVRVAFELATATGRAGDVVLAPACASQDMFRDYRERGDRFAAAARSLSEENGAHR